MKQFSPRSPTFAAFLLLLLPAAATSQERMPIHGTALTAPYAVASLLDPFRADPSADEVSRTLATQAHAAGFPQTMEDQVLVARLWRRAGLTDEALSTLERIPTAETGALALLERARVLLEADAHRDGGTRAYWAACESIDPVTLTEVRSDLLPVSTPEERDAWAAAPSEFRGCEWLRDFWNERAQGMAISADERVALHYRRLAHARDWYWIPRPRTTEGWGDKRGRPDGLAIDDRGLMFVRMGPPETDEGFIGFDSQGVSVEFQVADLPSEATSFVTGIPDDALDEQRCWPYPRPTGYRIFCFSQTSVSGQARADGDYKLQQTIVAQPGTHFYHKYVLNSNLPAAWLRDRLRARVAGLSSGGPEFGRFRLRDSWEIGLNRAERRAYGRYAELTTRDNISAALEAVPDVPALLPTARIRVETLRFLNPSERSWEIWTLASVRAGDLTPAPGADGVPSLVAGGRFSALKPEGVEVHEIVPRQLAEASVSDDAGIPLTGVFSAEPGPLPLTVVIEDGNRAAAGNFLQSTINVPKIGGLPQVSDIAVASSTGGSWTRDGEIRLAITPAHITNPDGSIHTYFEVYGVRPGTTYQVELRLAPVEDTERIFRLDREDLEFRLEFAAEMTGDIGRHYLRLDLGEAAPGEYTLAMRIQDENTKAYSLPAITDIFVAKGGNGR